MNKEELRTFLSAAVPGAGLEETVDFVVLRVKKEELLAAATLLHDNQLSRFDYLFCQTAVDLRDTFDLIYHLSSNSFKHNLVLKVRLEDREKPELPSVTSLWQAAELYECEIFDLFGISFTGHPNLRRLFLSDDWVGFPLRKDYRDEVNIISL